MDFLDSVVSFLKENNLDSAVQEIEKEKNSQKVPVSKEEYLNTALQECLSVSSLSPDIKILKNFIKKIEKNPVSKIRKYKKTLKREFLVVPAPVSKPLSIMSNSDLNFTADPLQSPSKVSYVPDPVLQATLTVYEESQNSQDQYLNDEDLGYTLLECKADELKEKIAEIIKDHPGIPVQPKPQLIPVLFKREESWNSEKQTESLLPETAKFPVSPDDYYPKEHENTTLDCFNMKIVFDRNKTGFEDTKDFVINIEEQIAGRYKVVNILASLDYSVVVYCIDEITGQKVCLKIIENSKEELDQGIDEIKILNYLKANGDLDCKNVVRLLDYFYNKEHLVLVTELLRDSLGVFIQKQQKNLRNYFTMGRIQKLAYNMLVALDYIHSLNVVHSDVKPDNILFKSYNQCSFKLIDFGSAKFVHDELVTYAQSRNYRAPEVILGFHYDTKIDIWSLGCILFEVFTGRVLFDCISVQEYLAKVIGLCGQFTEDVYKFGRYVKKYFTKERIIFLELDDRSSFEGVKSPRKFKKKYKFFVPKQTSLKNRMNCDDLVFVDFVRSLLAPNKMNRLSAKEALLHPFIRENRYPDGIVLE